MTPAQQIKECTCGTASNFRQMADNQSSWSYIYLHNRRIEAFKAMMDEKSPFTSFVLKCKSPKPTTQSGLPSASTPAPRQQLLMGGVVFIQGEPQSITNYFNTGGLPYRLVYDCATHLPAVIADREMRPLRQAAEVASERLSFLPKPFSYYEQGHKHLRAIGGPLQGLEGCVLRIHRDRKLVMGIGNLTLAIDGVHREQFEEVEPQPGTTQGTTAKPLFGTSHAAHRRLTYLQETIDKNLFFPQSQQEVAMYADNLGILLQKALQLCDPERQEAATDMLLFLLEEMAYHTAPLYADHRFDLNPIFDQGRQISREILQLTTPTDHRLSPAEKEHLQTAHEAFLLTTGYLLG